MKKIPSLLALLISVSVAIGQSSIGTNVYFESSASSLDLNAKEEVEAFAKTCLEYDFVNVRIEGHTDTEGDAAFNDKLAENRVGAVLAALVAFGLDPNELDVASFGESRPINDELTDTGRALNRRVTLRADLRKVNSIEEVYGYLSEKYTHTSTYAHDSGTRIVAPQGSIVIVPAGAYKLNGMELPKGAEVKLSIAEGISPASIVAHRLSTNGPESSLGTGGMIRVSATWQDKELSLKQGKAIQIKVPLHEEQEGMQLYVGDRDTAQRITWDKLEENDGSSRLAVTGDNRVEFTYNGPDIPVDARRALGAKIQNPKVVKRPKLLKFTPLPAPFDATKGQPRKPYRPREPKRRIAGKPRGLFAQLGNKQAQKQDEYDRAHELALNEYSIKKRKYEEDLRSYEAEVTTFVNNLEKRWKTYQLSYDSVVQIRTGEAEAFVSEYNKSFATQAVAYRKRYFTTVDSTYKLTTGLRLLASDFAPISSLSKEEPASFGVFYAKALGLPVLAEKAELNQFEKVLYDTLMIRHEVRMNRPELNFEYRDILTEVNQTCGNTKTTNSLLEVVEAYLGKLRVYNAEKRDALASKLNNTLRYYNFEIRAPRPSWYNIDHPLLAGEYQFGVAKQLAAEAYCYLPSKNSFEYFPSGVMAANMYDQPFEVRYLSFVVAEKGLEIAQGQGKAGVNYSMTDCNYQQGTLRELESILAAWGTGIGG